MRSSKEPNEALKKRKSENEVSKKSNVALKKRESKNEGLKGAQ
jgi:hypothetical protein